MALAFALALAAATPEAQLAAVEAQARVQERRLATAQAPLAALLARVERIVRRPTLLALLDGGASDLIRSRALLASLRPMLGARIAALQRQRITTEAARAQLAQHVAERAETRARFGSLDRAALNRRLAVLPGPVGTVSAPAGKPVYRLPAVGRVVIGTGDRTDDGLPSSGLTLATAPGTAVIAPAAGRIAYAGPFRGYGDIVLLDHGGGWATLLAGLALATVGVGETVPQGAPLGRMGPSPRLTIELRHHGRPVDVAGMAAQRR
ncbi:murein hydrolase activator EnvC family protein [Sphingomonas sp.]|uniref:murein hydrolase activator EnvC family protein n=1 Tax=Sphingomonas sp. TaxID=28214 RepID=UPI003B3AC1D2